MSDRKKNLLTLRKHMGSSALYLWGPCCLPFSVFYFLFLNFNFLCVCVCVCVCVCACVCVCVCVLFVFFLRPMLPVSMDCPSLIAPFGFLRCFFHNSTRCRGGSRGRGSAPGARPPKIGKNMIFWRKIVIFHTKYPKNVRASLRNWKKI